ncbi:hypothetical protein A2U01_0117439, partial [Trifolium medium]|nr:hypothetical protein [Trifolium medium]
WKAPPQTEFSPPPFLIVLPGLCTSSLTAVWQVDQSIVE